MKDEERDVIIFCVCCMYRGNSREETGNDGVDNHCYK